MPVAGEKKLLIGMSDILHARLQSWAKERKVSMSEAAIQGIRNMLDGMPAEAGFMEVPTEQVVVNVTKVNDPLGRAGSVVGLGPDPKVGFGLDAATFLGLGPGDKIPESGLPAKHILSVDDDEDGYYENLCNTEFGAKYIFQAMKQLGKRWNQMSWKARYEWFVEKREREAGG